MNLVLIVPAALLDKANALGAALDGSPNSYSIALSPSGAEPATHFGLNLVDPSQSFIDMLALASDGHMPDGLDFPEDEFAQVMAELISDEGEFSQVVAAHGLLTVGAPE